MAWKKTNSRQLERERHGEGEREREWEQKRFEGEKGENCLQREKKAAHMCDTFLSCGSSKRLLTGYILIIFDVFFSQRLGNSVTYLFLLSRSLLWVLYVLCEFRSDYKFIITV